MTMRTTLLLSLLLAPAAAWRRAPVMAAGPSRREAIGTAAAGLGLGLGLGFVKPATAAAPAADVVILGASGRTGRAAAAYAVSKGMSVAAGTRSGKMPDGMDLGSAGSSVAADVKDYEQLLSAVRGAGAVIYAASASNKKDFKKADDARAVDYDGVVNAARACIDAGVPRLVVVSSGAVTRPDSPAYKFTNLFGKIMDYKIKGEDELRGLYAAKGDPKLTYTIVRPGGLTEEPLKGVKGIALNQGDEFIGRIGREDVAAVCVEAISQKSAANAIIEAYDRDTAQPLVKGAAPTRQRLGDTWDEMFAGVSAN